MFRKSKNRKLVEEKYKNGIDVKWYLPSSKKFFIETEFMLDHKLEQIIMDSMNNNRDTFIELKRNIQNVVRDTIINSLIATGRGTP
jgi:hypothetical protein